MLKRNTIPVTILILSIAFLIIIPAKSAHSETGIRDTFVRQISRYIWHYDYHNAIDNARAIVINETQNPVGYFLLGTIYQTISEEYRTDRFKDSVTYLLDKAIALAEERIDSDPENPDWHFITGAGHGYRALHRAFHGDWWGAFKDGLKCSSHLERTLELDSTFYDTYLGLGAYHYWKTVKSKVFLWLPFVSDRREQGIEELIKATRQGYLSTYNARESLLRVYLNEGRYPEMLRLADSLAELNPGDPYCLLYHAQGLIAVGRFDEAEEKLRMLRAAWKKSPFYDPFGFYEAEYLTAEIFYKRGDKEAARKIIDKIISDRAMRSSNAYFAETLDKAESLAKKLQ
jgi:tetratricopeptide (TPR) repeat protein